MGRDRPPRTILITGASSGIGRATAELFARKGWNVAATMRHPETAEFAADAGGKIRTFRLDVTDEASIAQAVGDVVAAFGRIDVLVNNAGYGLVGVFEAMSSEQVRRQVETNVIGVMNVTRAVLPVMRAQRAGHIVSVASVAGRISLPLYTLYCATKWAVEGFTEALSYEARHFGIKVRIIEPGPIATDFMTRSLDVADGPARAAYAEFESRVMEQLTLEFTDPPGPEIVARAIHKSVTAWPGWKIRYKPNGALVLFGRRLVPTTLHVAIARRLLGAAEPLIRWRRPPAAAPTPDSPP